MLYFSDKRLCNLIDHNLIDSNIDKFLESVFKNTKFSYRYRYFNENLWDKVLKSSNYYPDLLSNTSLDYQISYVKSFKEILDKSIIIFLDSDMIAVFNMFVIFENKNIKLLSANLESLVNPIFIANISYKIMRDVITMLLNIITEFSKIFKVKKLIIRDIWLNEIGISIWFSKTLSHFESHLNNINYMLYVDTKLRSDDLIKKLKKSVKYDINKGKKLYDYELFDNCTVKIWDDFKLLHFQSAGKKTRSDDSWDKQFYAIKIKKAFLITVREKSGDLIGGAYFTYSKFEMNYAVAAYRRDLFENPIAHAALIKAIEYANQLKIKWLFLGEKQVAYSENNKKKFNISKFKESFATHTLAIPEIEIVGE